MIDKLAIAWFGFMAILGLIWTSFLVWSLCSVVIWLTSGEVMSNGDSL